MFHLAWAPVSLSNANKTTCRDIHVMCDAAACSVLSSKAASERWWHSERVEHVQHCSLGKKSRQLPLFSTKSGGLWAPPRSRSGSRSWAVGRPLHPLAARPKLSVAPRRAPLQAAPSTAHCPPASASEQPASGCVPGHPLPLSTKQPVASQDFRARPETFPLLRVAPLFLRQELQRRKVNLHFPAIAFTASSRAPAPLWLPLSRSESLQRAGETLQHILARRFLPP